MVLDNGKLAHMQLNKEEKRKSKADFAEEEHINYLLEKGKSLKS